MLILESVIGVAAIAFADLVEIVRCDPGLTISTPNLFWSQVHYTQKNASVPSSKRVLELVNSPVTVTICAVNSTYAPFGDKLIETQGLTRVRSAPDQAITIWYDVTDAGGWFYWVLDKNSQSIYQPRQVLLYHELSHAYHDIIGDLPAQKRDREIQAMADENVFRAQLGVPLRHPTNHEGGSGTPPSHGGTSFPSCKPVQTGWSPGWKCKATVATEVIGSPHAPLIEALRRARAEYRTVGLWAALIAQPALERYAAFSSGVALHMRDHPALRHAMLLYAVQPTFQLLRIAEAYLAADADTPAIAATVKDALGEYVSAIAGTGGPVAALRDASRDAAAASRLLASGAGPVREIAASPEAPDRLFSYLAREILSVKRGSPAAFAWGLEGLALFLHQAATMADGLAMGDEFLPELGSWVARLPLPAAPYLRISDAHRELSVLAQRIFTRPGTRDRFARHLLAQWPSTSTVELQAMLADLGYFSGTCGRD